MRIVFYGTPDFAVASLRALLATEHEVVGVVTAPDKRGGRGGKRVLSSAVKGFAEAQRLPLAQPTNLKGAAFAKTLDAWAPDLQVVVAFRMLPEAVWAKPPLGTVNVHGSLLPAYRGAAPIHWAVINGERETGVTIFFLRHAIDTGAVLLQARTPVGPDETTGEVYERLMHLGAETLVEALGLIAAGETAGTPQDDTLASHAPKLTRDNTRVDWTQPAARVHDFVRGLHPFPTAWTTHGEREVKILRTARHESIEPPTRGDMMDRISPGALGLRTVEGRRCLTVVVGHRQTLVVEEVKPAGSRRMSGLDFWNGLKIGDVRSFG